MNNQNALQFLKKSLASGIAYGIGFMLGGIVTNLIFNTISLPAEGNLAEGNARFILGILFAIFVSGLGGGIGGFIGGWTLPIVGRTRGRWGYSWKSAISIAIPFSLILFVLMFLIYALSVTDVVGVQPRGFAVIFAVFGVIFGLFSGLILGGMTVGRRMFRVALASVFGYALGGVGLGLGLYAFLDTIPTGGLMSEGSLPLMLVGLFVFGLTGGCALGYVYYWLAEKSSQSKVKPLSKPVKVFLYGLLVVGIFFVIAKIWPLLLDLGDMLTPRSANLSTILYSDTVDTDWYSADVVPLINGTSAQQPSISINNSGQLALAWSEENGEEESIHLVSGSWDEGKNQTNWSGPSVVSSSTNNILGHPQVVIGETGSIHVIWLETDIEGEDLLYYSNCDESVCEEPVLTSILHDLQCGGDTLSSETVRVNVPAIAVNASGSVMVVWGSSQEGLAYATWDSPEGPSNSDAGCVPISAESGGSEPRLTVQPDGTFLLIYSRGGDPSGSIMLREFNQSEWSASEVVIGKGYLPQVWVDYYGEKHAAWCGEGGGVVYWNGDEAVEISGMPCVSRPEIGRDNHNRLHVVFASDVVKNAAGVNSDTDVLYEIVQNEGGWAPASIIDSPELLTQPAMVSGPTGALHLAWMQGRDNSSTVQYMDKLQYDCENYELTGLAYVAVQIAQQERYRPAGDIIAYCQNEYNKLVFTPNPSPEFSENTPTPNGGFDQLAELMRRAEYEVLFVNMAYDASVDRDGPGVIIGDAIVDLYEQLKADPSRYPRGLTVRILLGNSPTLDLNSQLWLLLEDLRIAGVKTMVDPDLGWRLEVANFEGAFPHSHSKLLVVDGKTAIAMGFNLEFRPLPEDHPSGLGKGDADLGIHVTGPIAQDARQVFDDLWEGAVQRDCTDLNPWYLAWQTT